MHLYTEYLHWLRPVADYGSDRTLAEYLDKTRLPALATSPIDSGSSQVSDEKAEILDVETLSLRLSEACADLDRLARAMEAWIKSGCTKPVDYGTAAVLDAIRAFNKLCGQSSISECPASLLDQVAHSLDRTRYYATRAVRSNALPASAESYFREVALDLANIAKTCLAYEHFLNEKHFIRGAIDTHLLVAHRGIRVGDPASYKGSLEHFNDAVCLLDGLQGRPIYLHTARCLTSTAFSCGELFYKAEKYATAIPYLAIACDVAQRATAAMTTESLDPDGKEMLVQLQARLERLASSHHHIRERKEAVDLYRQAIKAGIEVAMYGKTPDEQQAQMNVIDQNEGFHKPLSRYTKLASLDLFKSAAEVSIAGLVPSLSPFLQGRLVEMQIKTLDNYWDRQEATSSISAWLQETETLYRSQSDAIPSALPRLCKILLRQLELSATTTGSLPLDELNIKAEEIARLSQAFQGPVSIAFSKIWLAFDAIRRKDPKASKILGKEAKEALKLLIDDFHACAITQSSVRTASSPPKSAVKAASAAASVMPESRRTATIAPPTRTTQRTLVSAALAGKRPSARAATTTQPTATSGRKPLSPKNAAQTTATARNITPQKVKVPKSPSTNKGPGSAVAPAKGREIDPWKTTDRAHSTLAALASILGAFGHTFLRISCLKLLRAIDESRSADGESIPVCVYDVMQHLSSSVDYAEVSVSLACEYQQLGKWSRAETVLARCAELADAGKLSAKVEVLLLLRSADFASCRGDHGKR